MITTLHKEIILQSNLIYDIKNFSEINSRKFYVPFRHPGIAGRTKLTEDEIDLRFRKWGNRES